VGARVEARYIYFAYLHIYKTNSFLQVWPHNIHNTNESTYARKPTKNHPLMLLQGFTYLKRVYSQRRQQIPTLNFFVSAVSNICKQLAVAKSSLSQRQFGFTCQVRSFSPRQYLSDNIFAKFPSQDEENDTVLIFRVKQSIRKCSSYEKMRNKKG
jgi:hypothetical protein